MRVIAVMNQKGGCGKTTTAVNLGACLAFLQKKTLIVDLDPQAHATLGLGIDCTSSPTLSDLMLDDPPGMAITDAVTTLSDHLHVLPSDVRLSAAEPVLLQRQLREATLNRLLDPLAGRYDFILLDCPPNIGVLTFNALFACTEALIPLESGLFALHGLAKLRETVAIVQQRQGREIPMYALSTMFDRRTRIAHETLREIRSHMPNVLATVIRLNVKLKEAAGYGQTIIDYDKSSKGFADYLSLAREVMSLRKMKKDGDLFDTTLPSAWPQEVRPGRTAVSTGALRRLNAKTERGTARGAGKTTPKEQGRKTHRVACWVKIPPGDPRGRP